MYLKDASGHNYWQWQLSINQSVNQPNSQSVIMKMMIVKDAGGPGHPMELWAGVAQQGLGWTLSVNMMIRIVYNDEN